MKFEIFIVGKYFQVVQFLNEEIKCGIYVNGYPTNISKRGFSK